ncbi:MAG: hypothetical protein IKN57_07320, partial [Parasporobacterium sp.]|nr:hypothetical protein [Parasporobacterium sp.]
LRSKRTIPGSHSWLTMEKIMSTYSIFYLDIKERAGKKLYCRNKAEKGIRFLDILWRHRVFGHDRYR